MKTINLRDYYPFFASDHYIEVPDEVAALLLDLKRYEAACQRRTYRHKAHYSLDRNDGIEHDILFVALSPCEIYERKVTREQLHVAIASLPDKQAKRTVPLFAKAARTTEAPPQSIGGREEVSLYPCLLSRTGLPQPGQRLRLSLSRKRSSR